jgi:hypothetical protein
MTLKTHADTPSGLPPLAPLVDHPALLTNGQPVDIYRGPSIPLNADLGPVEPKKKMLGPASA